MMSTDCLCNRTILVMADRKEQKIEVSHVGSGLNLLEALGGERLS